MPNTTSLREKHFPALDGLRGLAALMVVAHHSAFSYINTTTFDKAYLRATSLLWIGVDLFFVLSGFLITNILLDTKRSSNYFRAFYGRRFVRIFPLYYAFLAVIYFLLPALGSVLSKGLTDVEGWLWTYMANVYVSFHAWPDMNINHLWTLAMEEQFYLIWPLIVLFCSEPILKRSIVIILFLLPFLRALCLTLGLPANFVFSFTLVRMDGLLFGALLSLISRFQSPESFVHLTGKQMQYFDWGIGISVFGLIVVYCVGLRNDQFLFNPLTWSPLLQCTAISLIAALFAYVVLRAISPTTNILQRVMGLHYLRKMGKYSYALYVLHAPICVWIGAHLPIPFWIDHLPAAWNFIRSLYLIGAEFAVSIAAAVLSWNILEKHFLKLKRYFPYEKPAIGMEPNELLAVQGEVG